MCGRVRVVVVVVVVVIVVGVVVVWYFRIDGCLTRPGLAGMVDTAI